MGRWIGRIAFVAVMGFVAHWYSAMTVEERITSMQETLIAPTGQRVEVSKTLGRDGPRRLTAAAIVATEEVPFGWRVTYAVPTRPNLSCTYRLPGITCQDGWTVVWSEPVRRR